MLHFPEVLVLALLFTVPLLLRLCAVWFIGFLFFTVSWGLVSFSYSKWLVGGVVIFWMASPQQDIRNHPLVISVGCEGRISS
jgi:hypothetical protein